MGYERSYISEKLFLSPSYTSLSKVISANGKNFQALENTFQNSETFKRKPHLDLLFEAGVS